MGSIISTKKPLSPLTISSGAVKPIAKQPGELDLRDWNKWNKLFKTNSHAITKLCIQLVYHPSDLLYLYTMIFLFSPARKAARILQNKTISSLHYVFMASSSFEMSYLICNLKDSCHITSLNLDLSSVESCTPQDLKYLSMTLGNFKKLASLTLTFPNLVEMTPKHIISLGFAFHRLRSLTDLSLKFTHRQRPNSPSLKPLAKLLSKLTRLKSLALSQLASTTPLAFTFLPPVLKKLTSLEGLNLDLAGMRGFQSKHLDQVFLTLKNNKPLKNITFNFKGCTVESPSSCPLSQGLAVLDLSQLQSFQLSCYSNLTNKTLEQLTTVLQGSPLKRLNLDLCEGSFSSSYLQFCLDLQAFQSLSHLSLNPGDLTNGIKVMGAAIKPLIRLQSLDIDFSKQITKNADNVDNELIDFSANLRGLQNLKHLSLNLKNLDTILDKDMRTLLEDLQLTRPSKSSLTLVEMRIKWNKGVFSLFSSLTKLEKLKDLSLDLSGNDHFSIENLHNLSEAIQNLSLLNSVSLNFRDCESLSKEKESFAPLFRSLGKLKLLKKIILHLPSKIEDQNAALDCINCVEDQTIHWDCLSS